MKVTQQINLPTGWTTNTATTFGTLTHSLKDSDNNTHTFSIMGNNSYTISNIPTGAFTITPASLGIHIAPSNQSGIVEADKTSNANLNYSLSTGMLNYSIRVTGTVTGSHNIRLVVTHSYYTYKDNSNVLNFNVNSTTSSTDKWQTGFVTLPLDSSLYKYQLMLNDSAVKTGTFSVKSGSTNYMLNLSVNTSTGSVTQSDPTNPEEPWFEGMTLELDKESMIPVEFEVDEIVEQ